MVDHPILSSLAWFASSIAIGLYFLDTEFVTLP